MDLSMQRRVFCISFLFLLPCNYGPSKTVFARGGLQMSASSLNVASLPYTISHCTLYIMPGLREDKHWTPVLKPGVTNPLWARAFGLCSCQHNSDNGFVLIPWIGLSLHKPCQSKCPHPPTMLLVWSPAAAALHSQRPLRTWALQLVFGNNSLLLRKWSIWDRWSLVCYCQQQEGEHISNVESWTVVLFTATLSLATAIQKTAIMHLMPGGNNT